MTASFTSLKGFYLISPPDFKTASSSIFLRDLEVLFESGTVDIFQLRIKNASHSDILSLARNISIIAKDYGVIFIVNDYLDIALECADGCHQGEEFDFDGNTEVPEDFIYGISCYDDVQRAFLAEDFFSRNKVERGYIAFGAFFGTTSKEKFAVPPLSIIAEYRESGNLPVCAIGGINLDNYTKFNPSPDMLAVISCIWGESDLGRRIEACRAFQKFCKPVS